MANMFDSIGKGIGGVLDFAGGAAKGAGDLFGNVVQGASDVAGMIPAVARQRSQSADIESRINERKLQMMNTAAGMLANTPPEQQESIKVQLSKAGFSPEDIEAARQIGESAQPPSFEEFSKIGEGSDLARTIDVGPKGKVTGGRFATRTLAQAKQPVPLTPDQRVEAIGGTQEGFQSEGTFPTAGGGKVTIKQRPSRAGKLQISRLNDPSGLPVGTVYQSDVTGKFSILSEPGGEGLTSNDKTKIALTQSKEFRADPRIKNLQIIERSERGMKAALKKSTAPGAKSRIASDQALGVLFQKMLDPTSVVRESEFARTPEGAALMGRIESQIPKLLKGGLAITDSDRQALVDMAQELLAQAKITANKAFGEFTVRADELGLNKKVVFGGAKPFGDVGSTSSNQGVDGQGQKVRTRKQEARLQELLKKQKISPVNLGGSKFSPQMKVE